VIMFASIVLAVLAPDQGVNSHPLGLRFAGRLFATNANQQIECGKWNVLGTLSMPIGAQPLISTSSHGSSGSVVVTNALRLVRRS